MTKTNKLLLCALSCGLVSFIGNVSAAEDTVLFKVHDIVPVKNADGNVVSCDIGATFYNRTANEIKNASLNLVWTDEVIGEAINQEERSAKEAQRANRRNTPRYNTASYTDKSIVLKLRLPPLKSYQQITLKSKVNTNRCFLLLNDMEIDVLNCGNSSGDKNTKSPSFVQSNCDGLFTYISPASPEYYNDFQAISVAEQTAQEDTLLQSKKDALNSAYQDALKQLDEVNKTLDGTVE
ncbi:MAG: hypothetical protein IJW72_04590 [Alphaproteobacteria bacterium]|nr:hypothetical protein [Alphaproteobacteria bacterium]MBQ7285509.1 hypothetical protein [Alphaproteobacteria bacterium]